MKEKIKHSKGNLLETKENFLTVGNSKREKKSLNQKTPTKGEDMNRISMSPIRDSKKIRDARKRKISMLLHGEEKINNLVKEVHHMHDVSSPFKYKHVDE
jgi:hypothetical protein